MATLAASPSPVGAGAACAGARLQARARALIESAGLTGQKLDSYHVGFLLAPRLNACGRMGHAQLAVEMLTPASHTSSASISSGSRLSAWVTEK